MEIVSAVRVLPLPAFPWRSYSGFYEAQQTKITLSWRKPAHLTRSHRQGEVLKPLYPTYSRPQLLANLLSGINIAGI